MPPVKRSTPELPESGETKWLVTQDPYAACAAATEQSSSSRAPSASPRSAPSKSATSPPASTASPARSRKSSGYGLQLREKQKAKRIYFTLETQFRAYYQKAAEPRPASPANFSSSSSKRVSTTSATASGIATSRRQARQICRHGHIQVNGKKVNIPSYQCKVGDEIAIREGSQKLVVLEEAKNFASGQRSVPWIDINRDNFSGKIIALPNRADVNLPVNEQLIVELYSK